MERTGRDRENWRGVPDQRARLPRAGTALPQRRGGRFGQQSDRLRQRHQRLRRDRKRGRHLHRRRQRGPQPVRFGNGHLGGLRHDGTTPDQPPAFGAGCARGKHHARLHRLPLRAGTASGGIARPTRPAAQRDAHLRTAPRQNEPAGELQPHGGAPDFPGNCARVGLRRGAERHHQR